MTVVDSEQKHEELRLIDELYERSFPSNERVPFSRIMDERKEHTEMLDFHEDGEFCGFAVLLNNMDITHIVYLAVPEQMRNRGLGGKILSLISDIKKGRRIIVDIERADKKAENNEQRIKRKRFYLKNGYSETPVKYTWRGEKYEILSFGGNITKKEFSDFWKF